MNERKKYRILEMIPGFLVWLTFIFIIALSLIKPLWAIYFIIGFDLYWLLRILYMLVHLLLSYFRFQRDSQIDWFAQLKNLDKDYGDSRFRV